MIKKHPKRQPITDQTGADRTNDSTRNIPQKHNKKSMFDDRRGPIHMVATEI